jgi:DNA-binding SARP family transcriptional activator
LLKAQQGSIVTRETIESTLWPREVVGLGSVNNTISRLRRLLGDTPKMPTYVETVARKGYRLIKQLDYRLLWFKKPKIKMIVNTSTAFLVLISLLTAVR